GFQARANASSAPSKSPAARRSSDHQIAAVDVEGGAGDVAGLLGGEEADEVGDLGGRAEALNGEGARVGGELLGCGVLPRQLGVDETGADRVDGDAEGSELLGGGAG